MLTGRADRHQGHFQASLFRMLLVELGYTVSDPAERGGRDAVRKAEILGCPESWTCDDIIENQIEFSGWDNIVPVMGDYDTRFEIARRDVASGVPVVVYTWTPSPYITVLRPGDNVYWMGVDDILDDSNPAGAERGEEHDGEGSTWRVSEWWDSLEVEGASFGETPTTVATFEGLVPMGPVAAGAAGLVVEARELEGAASVSNPLGEIWVGWSADGTRWDRQAMSDAFGTGDGLPLGDFAVGRDFVIARVTTWQILDPVYLADDGSLRAPFFDFSLGALPPRWFIARIPEA